MILINYFIIIFIFFPLNFLMPDHSNAINFYSISKLSKESFLPHPIFFFTFYGNI